ncbi:MAG: carboxymethylenebutenolidase [Hyphomicrobiales bacterium]|nr:carboxymethylenebutenolidase [Hyphomicrobiales bacterium]
MDQRIIDLYDEYTHRPLDRRLFLERMIALAGSAAAADAMLSVLEPNYALAAVVEPADPRIGTTTIDVPSARIKGYLAFPKEKGPEVAGDLVIVIHENRGLNPHIQDIARRLAVEGFHAFAPDFLTVQGGTPQDDDKARDMFAKIDMAEVIGSAAEIVNSFKEKNAQTKVGAIGFCWGGGVVNSLATASLGLDAGVVYYGVAPKIADVPQIKASMMMHHASLDTRVNATLPPYEAAMKEAKVKYQVFMYEGANHAFNNDTSPERYNEAAAKLAWSRSIAFLKEKLA